MRTSFRLAQLGLALIATVLAAAESPTGVTFRPITFEAAQAAAKSEDKLVFIDFFTTWCGPCKQLDRTTWQDPAVARLLGKKAIALKIDAEKEPALAQRYQIEAYPTLLLLKPDGTELGRLVGYRPAGKFVQEFAVESTGVNAAAETTQRAVAASQDAAAAARFQLARKHAASGKHAEALQEYVWCFDEGMLNSPTFAGARCTFLTGEWGMLAKLYPPARVALVERRDRAARAAESPTSAPAVLEEYAALNEALGEGDLTFKMYESLPPDSQRRAILRSRLFDRLVTDKRYEEAALAQPAAQMIDTFDRMAGLMKNRLSSSSEIEAFSNGVAPSIAAQIEVLIGSGQIEAAGTLRTKLLELADTPEVRSKVTAAASRAGRPDLWTASAPPDAAAKPATAN